MHGWPFETILITLSQQRSNAAACIILVRAAGYQTTVGVSLLFSEVPAHDSASFYVPEAQTSGTSKTLDLLNDLKFRYSILLKYIDPPFLQGGTYSY